MWVREIFTATLTHKHASSQQKLFIVQGLKHNLLGLPALISLNLLSRLDLAETTKSNVEKLYPQLFNGLQRGIYCVTKRRCQAIHTSYCQKHTPVSKEQVQMELEGIESLGVISPVSYPSPWCAGMVVVAKPLGRGRIGVNLKHLLECSMSENFISMNKH